MHVTLLRYFSIYHPVSTGQLTGGRHGQAEFQQEGQEGLHATHAGVSVCVYEGGE